MPATFKYLCSSCAHTVYMCRCYNSARIWGWEMRPEWVEAEHLAQTMPETERREAQRALKRTLYPKP